MGILKAVETRPCVGCGKRSHIEVDLDSYVSWRTGTYIQEAFPNLTAGERELLMTGTHDACWDALWAEVEEAE